MTIFSNPLFAQYTKVVVWETSKMDYKYSEYRVKPFNKQNTDTTDTVNLIKNKSFYIDTIGVFDGLYIGYFKNSNIKRFEDVWDHNSRISSKEYYKTGDIMSHFFHINDTSDNSIARIEVNYFLSGNTKSIQKDTILLSKKDTIVEDNESFSLKYGVYLKVYKREYYENGQIKEIVPYVLGEKTGYYYKYSADGELIVFGKYLKGKREGVWLCLKDNKLIIETPKGYTLRKKVRKIKTN